MGPTQAIQSYDYIVVGAGSAGCVIAGRLSEDPDLKVCLLEAGPPDKSIYIHMPAGIEALFEHPRYNWMHESEPEPHLNGRRIYCPRGRTLGGSSAINGMVFLRGHPLDFDGWSDESGLASWSYAHVLPYFKRLESWSGGESPYRGSSGPVGVTRPEPFSNELNEIFIEAGGQAGHGFTEDVNGFRQEGVFRADQSIRDGKRSSAAVSYLRRRPNLHIVTGAFAQRIVLEGKRAVGVVYGKNGRGHDVRCEREVLLCAGAVRSPQLLMLSGIGQADDLGSLGIAVRHELCGVGRNLQDHVEFYLLTECTQPVTLYGVMNPLGKLRIGLQWLMSRRGLGATNHFETGAYLRTDPSMRSPNIQNILIPLAATYDGEASFESHGYAVSVGIMRPKSRGQIRVRSDDPMKAPEIRFNFLQEQSDIDELRDGLDMTRAILAQHAFAPYRGREISPGADVRGKAETVEFLRSNITSVFHLCGTCRMGQHDMAVVDEDLRVRGIDGLRVVDASVMPNVPSANINAAVLMIGEKAADAILGRDPLPPENLPYHMSD